MMYSRHNPNIHFYSQKKQIIQSKLLSAKEAIVNVQNSTRKRSQCKSNHLGSGLVQGLCLYSKKKQLIKDRFEILYKRPLGREQASWCPNHCTSRVDSLAQSLILFLTCLFAIILLLFHLLLQQYCFHPTKHWVTLYSIVQLDYLNISLQLFWN